VSRKRNPKAPKHVDPDGLTARQRAFVNAYLAGPEGVRGNATQAAIKAGYAVKSAKITGSRMLTNANVAAVIASMSAQATKAAQLDLQKMVAHWSAIAFSKVCLADYFEHSMSGTPSLLPQSKWSDEMKLMCQRVTQSKQGLTVELRDRDHAMDMLSKYTGGFNDRVTLSGDKHNPLHVQQTIERDPELDQYTRDELKAARARLSEQRRQQIDGSRNSCHADRCRCPCPQAAGQVAATAWTAQHLPPCRCGADHGPDASGADTAAGLPGDGDSQEHVHVVGGGGPGRNFRPVRAREAMLDELSR